MTNLADTTTTLNATATGIIDTKLGRGSGLVEDQMSVILDIYAGDTNITLHLEPLEAVELATNLLLYARAAAWDGEVL